MQRAFGRIINRECIENTARNIVTSEILMFLNDRMKNIIGIGPKTPSGGVRVYAGRQCGKAKTGSFTREEKSDQS